MIDLPDLQNAYDYENHFYLTASPGRLGKFISHYELYKIAQRVPGAIVECGVFKGASFLRFAAFRAILESSESREMIAFDTFGRFPETTYAPDKPRLSGFIAAAGSESIGRQQLADVLKDKQCDCRVKLIEGDILQTVPEFVASHPELKIALLHIDVDLYEPTLCILRHLLPHVSGGGVIVLDDYGIFPGATKAVDEAFALRSEIVAKLPFSFAPAHIIMKSGH